MSELSFPDVRSLSKGNLPDGRVAVIDIGSNSVRFVVYESASRAAVCVHNEKTICCIGRNMANTGLLYREGCDMAIDALKRYRILARKLGVKNRIAVATAAARDAINGAEFVHDAEAAWGAPVCILAGEAEARLAGLGVAAGLLDADGVVGDLGGGSLDMVQVDGFDLGRAGSLPLGPLRLADAAGGDAAKARKLVQASLDELGADFFPAGDKTFYAVGGIWRALARVDMALNSYPLHVLSHYVIPAERALDLAGQLMRQGKKAMNLSGVVSKRRIEMLPFGAAVLHGVLSTGHFREVMISAAGVREGLVFSMMSETEQDKDPLQVYAERENARLSRSPNHARDLFAFTQGLFPQESEGARRLRRAAIFLCDIGWRRHPDFRAIGSYDEVLHMPVPGVDHHGRAFMAAAVFHRYSGDTEVPDHMALSDFLTAEEEERAVQIGFAARLAFDLSGAAAGELQKYRLEPVEGKLRLRVPPDRSMIADETVSRRLKNLAAVFGLKPEITVL